MCPIQQTFSADSDLINDGPIYYLLFNSSCGTFCVDTRYVATSEVASRDVEWSL